jgi:hypothetical protein
MSFPTTYPVTLYGHNARLPVLVMAALTRFGSINWVDREPLAGGTPNRLSRLSL